MIDTGDYYEKIENGQPKVISTGGYAGFAKSRTPELCASKTPAASLFGGCKAGGEGLYHIYCIDKEPDIDISDCGFDFGVLEEVRYRNPSENPVHMTHYATVHLPERAVADTRLAYVPPDTGFIHEWARCVKDAFSDCIHRENPYPRELETVCDVERPREEAYQDPYQYASPESAG